MNRPLAPELIHRTLDLDCSTELAFEIWTEAATSWWPAGHSLSGRSDIEIIFEPRAGGRFFERTPEGAEYDWGRVVVWDPPGRLVYDWFLGGDEDRPSRVQVTFTVRNDGGTRLEVEHRSAAMPAATWAVRSPRFGDSWRAVLAAFERQIQGA